MKKLTSLKRFAIAALVLAGCIDAQAQPNWAWARNMGATPNSCGARSIVTDASGGVYVGGTLPGRSLLAKLNASGNLLWSADPSESAFASAIALDNSGNIYVTGYYMITSAIFGSDTLPLSAYASMFIAKFDGSGHPLWARRGIGTTWSTDLGQAIVCDGSGNVIVSGIFDSDSLQIGNTTLINPQPHNNDIFLASYDGAGNVLWAKSIGNAAVDHLGGLACDASGAVYVSGTYGVLPLVLDTVTLPGSASEDIFLAKYNNSGNLIWAKNFGGPGFERANAMVMDASGNLLVTGSYTADFPIGSTVLPAAGFQGIFLAKFSPSGDLSWAQNAGAYATPAALTIDHSGDIYIGGSFATVDNPATFGPSSMTSFSQDPFVASYTSSGVCKGAVKIQPGVTGDSSLGNFHDELYCLYSDNTGNVYAGGYFESPSLFFGSSQLNNASPAGSDIFIAKFNGYNTGVSSTHASTGHIAVYPNPCTSQLHVAFQGEHFDEVALYNSCGTSVFTSKVDNNRNYALMNLENMPDGVYLVRATGAAGSETVTVVLAK